MGSGEASRRLARLCLSLEDPPGLSLIATVGRYDSVEVALVAEGLGHDIKTPLRTYAHVIPSDEDRVRAVVEDVLGKTAGDRLRTEGVS